MPTSYWTIHLVVTIFCHHWNQHEWEDLKEEGKAIRKEIEVSGGLPLSRTVGTGKMREDYLWPTSTSATRK